MKKINKNKQILTNDQIMKMEINKKATIYAIRMAEKRLTDTLETKKDIENKSMILLKYFVFSGLAFLSLGPKIYPNETIFIIGLILSGVFLLIASIFLLFNLRAKTYGTHGSQPEIWIRRGIIDAKENNAVFSNLTCVANSYEERIIETTNSNKKKNRYVLLSLIMASISLFLIIVALVYFVITTIL